MFQTVDDGEPVAAADMTPAKRGRAPYLGDLDQVVQDQVHRLREEGACVNTDILISTARGLVHQHDRTMLPEYGGTLRLTRGWAQSIMQRMGFVWRAGTKAARKMPENFSDIKAEFLDRITEKVVQHNIPPELVINIDQTGVSIVPTSKYTMAPRGSKQVSVLGIDDKRQITALLGSNCAGTLLPPQLIYGGKTDMCHPAFTFPREWDITHSPSHWSTEQTMLRYVRRVLVPFIDKIRFYQLDRPVHQRALVIMDLFAAHRCDSVLEALKAEHVEVVYVPGGCTGELQPLDVAGNGTFKAHLKREFGRWHSTKVSSNVAQGRSCKVDLKLSTLKPIHARWLLSAVDTLAKDKDELLRGWQEAGISAAVDQTSTEYVNLETQHTYL